MLWILSEKLYHLSKETRMKRKRKVFVKVLEKVKLVLVNIRFRLDISMPVMVTNPSIGFRAWHKDIRSSHRARMDKQIPRIGLHLQNIPLNPSFCPSNFYPLRYNIYGILPTPRYKGNNYYNYIYLLFVKNRHTQVCGYFLRTYNTCPKLTQCDKL